MEDSVGEEEDEEVDKEVCARGGGGGSSAPLECVGVGFGGLWVGAGRERFSTREKLGRKEREIGGGEATTSWFGVKFRI